MRKYNWSKLQKQQVGAYVEYFVKMELTMFGFLVYSPEVDDHGIDFVARYEKDKFIEVQVKSLRLCSKGSYTFMQKKKFELREHLYLALGLLSDGQLPELYLIPSTDFRKKNSLFANHDFEGLKSRPEWGLNISKKNMSLLKPYLFENIANSILNGRPQPAIG